MLLSHGNCIVLHIRSEINGQVILLSFYKKLLVEHKEQQQY